MKTRTSLLTISILSLLLITVVSCERKVQDQNLSGHLEIAVTMSDEQGLKSEVIPDSSDIQPWFVLLSITQADGQPVLEDEMLPMYRFGTGFVTEKIVLKTGKYKLTKFMIIDPSGDVVYAAPLEGSTRAYLVSDPLPINFGISAERITQLFPEVLPVNDSPPSDFGYASFGYNLVKTFPFFILVTIDDNSLTDPVVPTDAALTVMGTDGWQSDFYLEARVNRIVIRAGSDAYALILEKQGYPTKELKFTARELMATSMEKPLVIPLEMTEMRKLVLQPGPETGKDAMISDLDPEKNFGNHPYFEATFLSEPILTVMRTNRSLIWFSPTGLPKSARIQKVMLTLYYDLPIVWDSMYYGGINADGTPDQNFRAGAVLQQVVEPWTENEVTWAKQPKTIEANQVYVQPFVKNANFIDIDVTSLYVPLQEIAAPNHGMMFRLYPEEQFPGFRFTSSDYKVPEMRPRLTIFYTLSL